MIEEIVISNMRLFEGNKDWRVPLSPLTVFCGTNSAGKSTILKALLLLCQTQSDSDTPNRAGRIRLTGTLLDLGNYRSLISHNDISQDVTVGLTTRDEIEARHLQTLLRMGTAAGEAIELPSPVSAIPYSLTARFRFGVRDGEPPQSRKEQSRTRKRSSQVVVLKETSFEFHSEQDLALSWKVVADEESDLYHILIPMDYFKASAAGSQFMDIAREPDAKYARVEALLRGILPAGLWAQSKSKRVHKPDAEQNWGFFPLPPLMSECTRDLEIELDNVHYLGPLRTPARRYYMTNLDVDPKMDPVGEFLPYVLRDRRDDNVYYVPPKGTGVTRLPLRRALDSWMHYLRTGEYSNADPESDLHEIDVASMKDVLLEFSVKTFGGEAHALADSGFGYSQILPIVVRGLIAPANSTIIIEQPELHLNPAIQVRLAEFLSSLVFVGKRLLVETHSEHIVNAIRVLAAEETSDQLSKNVEVIYVDTESGKPKLKYLEIQPDGIIPEWPRQFFGEALTLSARLLKAQSRKKGESSAT